MKKFVVLATILLATCLCVHEIKMNHRERTPLEAKMFIDYMNRGPLVQGTLKVLENLYPVGKVPNLYSYPEVKIINYLDAQYYG